MLKSTAMKLRSGGYIACYTRSTSDLFFAYSILLADCSLEISLQEWNMQRRSDADLIKQAILAIPSQPSCTLQQMLLVSIVHSLFSLQP